MKVAVTSQNFRTVTPHPGRARRFLIFEGDIGTRWKSLGRLELENEATIGEWNGNTSHPLANIDVIITASFGEHFASRMAERGIIAFLSHQSDPKHAIADLLSSENLVSRLLALSERRVARNGATNVINDEKYAHGRCPGRCDGEHNVPQHNGR